MNKQYSKEDYEILLPKIIEHMRKTGEWGEFFPIECSVYGYNDTVAQEYFPLAKEEAISKGYNWHDEEKNVVKQTCDIHENIMDVPDAIVNEILQCSACQKNYRIVTQELTFLKKRNLPIPKKCPDCRHKRRMSLRNPRKLWERTCDVCNKNITSTYANDRPEKVFCESCYLATIY